MDIKKDQKKEFWHNIPINDVLIKLDSHSYGLTSQESHKRLNQYGDNSLKTRQKKFVYKHHLTRIGQYLSMILLGLIFISNLLE